MTFIFILVLSVLLDLLLGDPAWMPHPVVLMGKGISKLEPWLRRRFPATPTGERWAGRMLALILPLATLLITLGVCWLAWLIHPVLLVAVNVFWGWQSLAMKGLKSESMRVYRALTGGGTLPEARSAVARIVGRDTQNLTSEGVTKAAVETVAENFSDGVFAPLFYLAIGGAPLALCYKAINTMDSMVAYKNERYLNFGRAAAKLDDAANFLPSRLAALALIGATVFAGGNTRNAFKIWRRDRRNHASPNSAQTEAVMAGALGVQLAGPAWYFGEFYDKPTIGDPDRPIEPEDIRRANKLLYGAGLLSLAVLCALWAMIVFL